MKSEATKQIENLFTQYWPTAKIDVNEEKKEATIDIAESSSEFIIRYSVMDDTWYVRLNNIFDDMAVTAAYSKNLEEALQKVMEAFAVDFKQLQFFYNGYFKN